MGFEGEALGLRLKESVGETATEGDYAIDRTKGLTELGYS